MHNQCILDISNKNQFDVINEIVEKMENHLTGDQLYELNKLLNESFNDVIITSKKLEINLDYEKENEFILEDFIRIKTVEGLSSESLRRYRLNITKLFDFVSKHYNEITADDIKDFIIECKSRGLDNTTIENYRRSFNSFYSTMVENQYVYKNPMKRISPIKVEKKVKHAFTNEEIELMRLAIPKSELRDRAIFELFLGSGIRLNELTQLNISDLDFNSKTFTVLGKGNKERICYMTDTARLFLKRYIDSRDDDVQALFVAKRRRLGSDGTLRYCRLSGTSIERMIKMLGDSLNIKAHPHKFRRTFATNALKRGMPIDQVQKLLGHESIDTTLIYVNVDSNSVKLNHQKYSN